MSLAWYGDSSSSSLPHSSSLPLSFLSPSPSFLIIHVHCVLSQPKPKALLGKYDEEIEGVQKKAFTLGMEGEFDMREEESEREMVKQRLMEGRVSLHQLPSVVASEYYTNEEMVAFRRTTRKKRKLRKKSKLKADDLIPLTEHSDNKQEGRLVIPY